MLAVDACGIRLSGLIAEPTGRAPRAVVVALPGAGMLAGYYDGPVDRSTSLLDLGATHGFTVWAIDRPGYGASADAPDELVTLAGQAEVLHAALDEYARSHDIGAGYFVVAHSYGLKVALVLAAGARGRRLLGVDGVGTGLRHTFVPGETQPPEGGPGDRGASWGPGHLYPPGTFARGSLAFAPIPAPQTREHADWPAVFRSIAPDIAVPVRMTFGEHERFWVVDDEALAEIRSLFTGTSKFELGIQEGAGHNISLGLGAREYHLRALAFAEECIAWSSASSG